MSIDWQHFTPWSALSGGMLIGAAAALLILANGRIAGISGIVGGLLRAQRGDIGWRVAFIGGLIGAPLLFNALAALLGAAKPQAIVLDASAAWLAIAGALVGVGTRYGAGCTSGHGVCGLARLSPRSLAATLTFMAAGFTTVYLLRHILAG